VSSGASKTCSARDERDARAAPRAVEARAWQRHAMDQQWSRVGERGQRTRARAASRRGERPKEHKGARQRALSIRRAQRSVVHARPWCGVAEPQSVVERSGRERACSPLHGGLGSFQSRPCLPLNVQT
jgi:hypothetical protein